MLILNVGVVVLVLPITVAQFLQEAEAIFVGAVVISMIVVSDGIPETVIMSIIADPHRQDTGFVMIGGPTFARVHVLLHHPDTVVVAVPPLARPYLLEGSPRTFLMSRQLSPMSLTGLLPLSWVLYVGLSANWNLCRNFIWWVEKAFRARSLTYDLLYLHPRMPLDSVIKQQILEGVQAIVFLDSQKQRESYISLQVFNRHGSAEAGYDRPSPLNPRNLFSFFFFFFFFLGDDD